MSNNLQINQSLPETGCTREHFYAMVRTASPTSEMVDGVTTQVLAEQIVAGAGVPCWRKYTVTHAQLQTAALSNYVTLFTLPGGGVVHGVKIKHSERFVGSGITDYKVSVGISGNATKYAAAYDVDTVVADTTFQLSTTVGGETHASTGTPILLTATTTGANLDQSSAGSVDVWVLYSQTA